MKATAMMTMAAVMGATAWASSVRPGAERKLTVCFDKGNPGQMAEMAGQAEPIASKMFVGIGVKLEWHSGQRFCQGNRGHGIVVSLSTNTPRTLLPGALAYALPFEGTHIEVFYDRINRVGPAVVTPLLAHVLVHEITHILQGTNIHSESGIMKARWEPDDYLHMETKPLAFTERDVILILSGLDARATAQQKLQ